MTTRHLELSTPAIIVASIAFAVMGTLAYGLMTPISPNTRVAVAFSALHQSALQ